MKISLDTLIFFVNLPEVIPFEDIRRRMNSTQCVFCGGKAESIHRLWSRVNRDKRKLYQSFIENTGARTFYNCHPCASNFNKVVRENERHHASYLSFLDEKGGINSSGIRPIDFFVFHQLLPSYPKYKK